MQEVLIKIESELGINGFGEKDKEKLVQNSCRNEISAFKFRFRPLVYEGKFYEVSLIDLKDMLEHAFYEDFSTGVILRSLYELKAKIRICNHKKKILIRINYDSYKELILRPIQESSQVFG